MAATPLTWEDIATEASLGSSRAFGMLLDRFGQAGAIERTRIAREVRRQQIEDELEDDER